MNVGPHDPAASPPSGACFAPAGAVGPATHTADASGSPPALPDDIVLHRLGFALTAAQEASTLLLQRAAETTAVRNAHDVLAESERLLDEMIAMLFPDDAVVGTKCARRDGAGAFCWYVDGLNGSRAYHRRIPFFGIVLALTHREQPVVGVVRLPALNETVYAARAHGAWVQIGMQPPVRACVSQTDDTARSLICTSSLTRWRKMGRAAAFRQLHGTFGWIRTWGDCYGHCLVATGRAEAMLDACVERPLATAMRCIVPEAGGHWVGGSPEDRSAPFAGSVNAGLAPLIRDLWTQAAERQA